MKLVTILQTINEEEIIEDCLLERLKHFDLISIIDSSTDNTPELCKSMAKSYPDRIIYQWDGTPGASIKYFRERLYESLKGKIDDNTWIWQLDTDIRFQEHTSIGGLTQFLIEADREGANCIACRIQQFYPTFEDIENNVHWKDFKYYSVNWRSKIIYKGLSKLYFKGAMQETPCVPDEKKASLSPTVRHYQYRNPTQIQKRIDRAFGLGCYTHVTSKDWHDYIIDKEFLSKVDDPKWRRPHHSWRSLVQLTQQKNGIYRT